MTRLSRLVVLIVGGIAPLTLVARTDQQDALTFRASADRVAVDVSVRRAGRAVTGLEIADFEVRDNGVLQTVTDMSFEKLPIDLTVALDVSASVTGAVLDQLKRAVQQLRADLDPRDRLRVMTFNTRVHRLIDFTDTPVDPGPAFAAIAPAGGTSLFDAVAVALAAPPDPDRRRLIMTFSDGGDSHSITAPDVLLRVARRSTATVGTVLASPATLDGDISPLFQWRLYQQLAADTGGPSLTVTPGADLTSAFRRMLEAFRSSYVLHFRPTGVDQVGEHTLAVRVRRAGLDVRARRSYMWR